MLVDVTAISTYFDPGTGRADPARVAKGVAHRDIKPANIVVASRGLVEGYVDFGIAKSRNDQHISAFGHRR